MDEQLELPEPSDASEPGGQGNGHDERALAAAARHALHDEELVAAYAGGAIEADAADELGRARAFVERCPVCRDLHADLIVIAAAHRATTALVAAAARDFRLTVEDAERLRPGMPVQSGTAATEQREVARPEVAGVQQSPSSLFFDRVTAAFRAAARPLGGTLVAAGLVGVLVGSFSLTAMQAGSAPTSLGAYGGNPAPTQVGGREDAAVPGETGKALNSGDDGQDDLAVGPATADPRIVLLGGSIALAVVGILLLALPRRRARGTR